MVLVLAAFAAATPLAAIATLWRTGVAGEIIATAVLVAATLVLIEVGVPVEVLMLVLVLIDVRVCIGMRIRIDVRIGIALERFAFERLSWISRRRVALFGLLALERSALSSLQRVALIALNVELALRTLQVALQRAAPALEILEISRLAELLTQRRVLESDSAAMRRFELPMIAVWSSHQIGAIESIVVDHIDGHRAAAAPTAVPAPVIVAPQRCTDGETHAETDHCGADHISRRVPVERRVGRVRPGAIDHHGVVDRNIIDARVIRLDLDIFGRWRRWQQRRIDADWHRARRRRRFRRRNRADPDFVRRSQIAVGLRLGAQ